MAGDKVEMTRVAQIFMKPVEVVSQRKSSLLLALQYDHKGFYTYSPLVEIYTIYAKVPLLTFHLFPTFMNNLLQEQMISSYLLVPS